MAHDQICKKLRNTVRAATEKKISSSFLNSIDKIFYLNPLDEKILQTIMQRKKDIVLKKVKDRGFDVELSSEVEDLLFNKSCSVNLGAKFIDKVLRKDF